MKTAFVEQKKPNLQRVETCFKLCAVSNHWANRGPVYRILQERFGAYLNLPDGTVPVPVANGGVALEAMARLHAKRAGRKLRWVASAYSFQNLGRGYFSDIRFCDCDDGGLLDIRELEALDPASFDGIIVTNPFGLYSDLSAYQAFAARTGKVLLADNAAGLCRDIPDLEWQAFSLHHTKPFGMGEGGLALVPEDAEEELYALVNYGPDIADEDRAHWFQNGKISDLSCALLLDRLEQADDWGPRNLAERERVIRVVEGAGLHLLHRPTTDIPMTSLPALCDRPIIQEAIERTCNVTFAKYYRPLAPLPRVTALYQNLVNIPCHADMRHLSDHQILTDLSVVGALNELPPRISRIGLANSPDRPTGLQARKG